MLATRQQATCTRPAHRSSSSMPLCRFNTTKPISISFSVPLAPFTPVSRTTRPAQLPTARGLDRSTIITFAITGKALQLFEYKRNGNVLERHSHKQLDEDSLRKYCTDLEETAALENAPAVRAAEEAAKALEQSCKQLQTSGRLPWSVARVATAGSQARDLAIPGDDDHRAVLLVTMPPDMCAKELMDRVKTDISMLATHARANGTQIEPLHSLHGADPTLMLQYKDSSGQVHRTFMDLQIVPNTVSEAVWDSLPPKAAAEEQMRGTWALQRKAHQAGEAQRCRALGSGTVEAASLYYSGLPDEAKAAVRLLKDYFSHSLARRGWQQGRIDQLTPILELCAVKARNRLTHARRLTNKYPQSLIKLTFEAVLQDLSDLDELWTCFSRYYKRQDLPGRRRPQPAVMDPTSMYSNLADSLRGNARARKEVESIAQHGVRVLGCYSATISQLYS